MATESVVQPPSTERDRMDAFDRINMLSTHARGVLQMIRGASPNLEDLPDDALHDASWAVERMVEEMMDLVDRHFNGV